MRCRLLALSVCLLRTIFGLERLDGRHTQLKLVVDALNRLRDIVIPLRVDNMHSKNSCGGLVDVTFCSSQSPVPTTHRLSHNACW